MKSFKQFTESQLSEEQEQLDEFLGGVMKSVGKAVKGVVGGGSKKRKTPTKVLDPWRVVCSWYESSCS